MPEYEVTFSSVRPPKILSRGFAPSSLAACMSIPQLPIGFSIQALSEPDGKRATPVLPTLTERETEVLKLAALGFTSKEIARKLDVGVKSVETYKARGSEKLGLRTRAELIRYASAQGWLADI